MITLADGSAGAAEDIAEGFLVEIETGDNGELAAIRIVNDGSVPETIPETAPQEKKEKESPGIAG